MTGNAQALADIKTQLASYSDWPLVFANDRFDPPGDGNPWIFLELRQPTPPVNTLGGSGQRLVTNDGFLRVHVMVQIGTGAEQAFSIADNLRNLLAMQSYGTITAFAATVPEIGQGTDDGNYNAASFSIRLRWHYYQ